MLICHPHAIFWEYLFKYFVIFCWIIHLTVLEAVFIHFRYLFFFLYMSWKYFLPICDLHFHFLHGVLLKTNIAKVDEVQVINIFLLWVICFMSYLRNMFLFQGYGYFSPNFSSKNFIVSFTSKKSLFHSSD